MCAFVPVAQESKVKRVNEGLGQFHIRKNRLIFCFRLCKKLPQSFTGTVDGTDMYLLLLESGLELVLDTMWNLCWTPSEELGCLYEGHNRAI